MRDLRLLIATIGAILVSVCSSNSQSFDGSAEDEQVRMASESLVVKSYKDAESSTVSTTKSLGEKLEEYQVYQGVMGRPGIDFPVYPHIPATNFNCRKVKKSGYYADLATDCQVFHICDGNRKISFLCPNGTIFRQSHLICDWWFRVDCGKSVELYEESAEQLAADQKVYKARSEERERRRKQGKSLTGENGEELTSSEVYALDEPFQIKGKKQQEHNRNQYATTRTPPLRFEGRKGERHSKKVVDSGITEKFPTYSRDKQNGRGPEKIRASKERQYSTSAPTNPESRTRVSFVDTPVTTPVYSTPSQKSRYQVQNAINLANNKENIQPAESGSLVEDLNNRNINFAYNNSKRIDQTFEVNNQNRNYNNHKRVEEPQQVPDYNIRNQNIETNNNFAYNNKRTEEQQQQPQDYNKRNQNVETNNFAYNSNKRTEEQQQQSQDYNNRNQNFETNNNFAYNNKRTEEQQQQPQDFNNRNQNFAFNNNQQNQTFEFRNDYFYNDNKRTETSTETNRGRTTNFAYDENKKFDQTFGFNKNLNFNEKLKDQTTENRNNFRTEQTYDRKTEDADIGVTAFTTEFFNYESKRTNPVERHGTVTPTAFTRKSQSSRYRTSTSPYLEQDKQEKQFFAETASFASNRGAKSYNDFQSQFNTYTKGVPTTTPGTFRTTFYTTPKPTETFPTTQPPRFTSQTFGNTEFFRTTTHRPVKQNSRKVTIYPSTNPQTSFTTRTWQTTTFPPYVETTTANEKFTVDDIYFTTSTPEREVEVITETQGFGVSQRDVEAQTVYENLSSTPKPEVDITLQELNINKNPTQPDNISSKSYEDFVREGLEVPPSSGPNALRSFALYFATTNNGEEGKTTTSYLPPKDGESVTTLSPFEIRKKELVKAVDELVQRSSANVSDHVSHEEALPNSLTPHTKDSYSALFPEHSSENHTSTSSSEGSTTESEFETTAFESFTEEPNRINKELTKNDLDGSQSRGLVEPDPHSDVDYSKVSPDLRELAQVFTKALSAYLDDPETFRKVLSEIRPTEPTVDSEVSSSNPLEYPSATQEDDEVLDFSDVTKATYNKKKTSTATVFRETTTEYFTESPTVNPNEIENFVLPVNQTNWATNIELTAPFFETLDQSQSNYYTPPPFIGTTNAIAEEINNEFTASDKLSTPETNDTVDSYLPIRGSVDDPSLPRYGGFQNNSKSTTKYSPYGSELTSTTYVPYGADITPTASPNTAATTIDAKVTTFNPNNVTSFFSHFSKNDSEDGEIQLAKELNNLVLLQKFTTPRGTTKESTTPEPNLSTAHFPIQNDIDQYQDVTLGNGEILEKNVRDRAGKSLHFPETTITSNYFEPDAKEINLELSPPSSSTPKGFLITYSLGSSSSSSEPATYLPKATTPEVQPTTYSPNRQTAFSFSPETHPPTPNTEYDDFSNRLTNSRSATEYYTTTPPPTTFAFSKSTKSLERLAQLQETLMFNTNNLTLQQRDQARVSVEEMMDTLNMTDSTADTLMKVMEMAAKNETYRRLVLLLVNDKSGRNKTIEEARLSLLKALLTPVINPQQSRTVVPIPETSRLYQPEIRSRNGLRRSKSIKSDSTGNVIRTTTTTTTTTTTQRTSNGKISRRGKTSRGLTRAESNYKSGLGNLGVIRRTIENSKNKQVRINSVDDAILNSDSRAVELLRSLYSLAARWG